MDETTIKIELLKLTSNLAEKESDRFWQRYSIVMYTNTGLLGIVSILLKNEVTPGTEEWLFDPIVILFSVALIGFVLSIKWFLTIKISLEYQDRWIRNQKGITSSETTIEDLFTGRRYDSNISNDPDSDLKKYQDPRYNMLWYWTPTLFVCFWMFLFIFAYIKLI